MGVPLFSEEFVAGWRAPTLPLLYKVLSSDGLRIAGQLAISITCWLALAAVLSSSLADRRMQVLGFVSVLVFSLSPEILLWDPDLLSESISISLTAALAASWLLLLRDPTGFRVALMLAIAAAWTWARDPHPYLLLLLAAVVAASLLVGGRKRVRVVIVAGLVAISAAGILSASVGYPRWQYPLQNVIVLRISADPEALEYFEDEGMPVTRRFVKLTRSYRETDIDPFLYPVDPVEPLMGFQYWFQEEGRGPYARFLLTHPGFVDNAFGHLDNALLYPDVDGVDQYESEQGPWRFPLFTDLLYPRNPWLPLVYLGAVIGLAIAAFARAGPRLYWVVPAFLIGSSLPFAVFLYHGDAIEIDRHAFIASLFLRLGTLLLLLMAVDRLLTARASATERPEARSR
ncbi:MAG: hypothetical protein AABM29_01450 [Actinomycetota bacterium]